MNPMAAYRTFFAAAVAFLVCCFLATGNALWVVFLPALALQWIYIEALK